MPRITINTLQAKMEEFYVYMFLDKEDLPLYIGRSINLQKRIETDHFKSENGNLSKKCIEETNKILYHKSVSLDDMKIKERYLINKLKPKYNKQLNNNSRFTFTIDFDWKLYSINKLEILEKQKKKRMKDDFSYSCPIIETPNAHFYYGVKFEEKIKYLIIEPEDLYTNYKSDLEKFYIISNNIDFSFFIKINNELYIHNGYQLGIYAAYLHGKPEKLLNSYGKHDYISITAPVDNILFKDYSHIQEDISEGLDFFNYKMVKKNKMLDTNLIKYLEKTINKVF